MAPKKSKFGPRTIRNYKFLYDLSEEKSAKKRWNMIKNATRDELASIVDVSSNISSKNFQLTPWHEKRIQKHLELVKKLGRSRSEKNAKKIIQNGEGLIENPNAKRKRDQVKVIQRGGFLPAFLVPVLVEVAAEIAENYLFPE